MKCSRYSPSSASMICSSWPVPSVATQNACVSPRVNSAEPCARGSTPTSAMIGRTVLVSRPSMRHAGVEDGVADDVGFQVLEQALGLLGVEPLGGQRLHGRLLRRVDLVVAGALVRLLVGLGEAGAAPARRPGPSAPAASADGSGSAQGSFAACSASSMIAWITGWKLSWPKLTAPSMTSSGSSLRLGLHHQHAFGGAGDHQFELAVASSGRRWG